MLYYKSNGRKPEIERKGILTDEIEQRPESKGSQMT